MENIIPFFEAQESSIASRQAEIETIRTLRAQGLSLTQIAKKTGVPKSTVEYRLKQGDQLLGRAPSKAVQEAPLVQPEASEVVQAKPSESSKAVQDIDWTNENSQTQTPPTLLQMPEVVQPQSSKVESHTFGWAHLGRLALILFPVGVLTPWLVFTSAEVYAKEVGATWGWMLALGFEAFFLVLATLAPSAALRLGSPKELVGSLPQLFKTGLWYALLLAMAAYSFHTMTLSVTEGKAQALTTVAAATATTTEVTDLRQERSRLTDALSRYEAQGWLGEARKIREDLRTLDARLDVARQRAAATAPASVAAIEHRASVGRYLRLFALAINVFCLHLAVRSISARNNVQISNNGGVRTL